jgi:hypothetical protein
LFAVDVDLQLRRIFQAVGTHLGEHGALHRHAQQLVACSHQRLAPEACAVLQAEGEAGGDEPSSMIGRRHSAGR